MRKMLLGLLFTLFIITQPAAGAKVNLAYSLSIRPNIMHVSLDYFPVKPDSTTFQYGNSNGGMKDLFNSLAHLQSSVRFSIDSANRKITFYYHNKSPVKITYDIIDTHKQAHKVVGEMFRPIVTSNYFFSLTPTLFLNPDVETKLQDSIMMSVTLQPHPAFPMYFSFAPEMKPGETVKLKLSEGIDALVTGASDLHIEKCVMAGIKNYLVLRINEKHRYNLKRFMDYFDAYLPAMTNFWGNLNGTYYTLVASPFLDITYHNISGTSFNGGFHVKFSGDTILRNEETVLTISHEIMHRNIGSGGVSIDGENEWFNEGFTDYTTWYLLAQSGIITKERFREIVKETYTKLSANPVRTTPNEDIMKHFWENHDYEKLPYQRGAMFAAYLDKRIVTQSNGSKTYRDFMRSLKAMAEQKKAKLSVDDFIAVASKYIPKDEIETAIRQYIMKGEMIPEKMIVKYSVSLN